MDSPGLGGSRERIRVTAMPVQKMKTMPITRIAHAKPTFGSDATKRTTSRSDAGCTAAFLAEEVADCCKGGGED